MIDLAIDEDTRNSWRKVREKFAAMDEVILDSAGKIVTRRLRDAIASQAYSWAPLKDSTYDAKITRASSTDPTQRSNFPTDTWRDTGALWGLLRWKISDDGDGNQVMDAGLFEEAGDRITAAAVLEYGSVSKRQPARPLFRPVAEEASKEIMDDIRKRVDRVLDDLSIRGLD